MAKDALEVAAQSGSFTLAKALDNLSLTQNFMGLLGRTIYAAHEIGKDIFKVKIHKPYFVETESEGNQIRAKISFDYDGAQAGTLNFMDRCDGMEDFIGKKSAQMAKVLSKNPTYMEFLQETVKLMENYALHEGKPFSEVEIIRAIITNDGTLVMVLL